MTKERNLGFYSRVKTQLALKGCEYDTATIRSALDVLNGGLDLKNGTVLLGNVYDASTAVIRQEGAQEAGNG